MDEVHQLRKHTLYLRLLILLLCIAMGVVLIMAGSLFLVDYIPVSQSALKKINHPGIKYSVYIMEDGKTFMHLDHFAGEAEHEFLQQLPEFRKFAAELWDSRMEVKPKLDLLSIAGSTVEFAG